MYRHFPSSDAHNIALLARQSCATNLVANPQTDEYIAMNETGITITVSKAGIAN